MGYQIKTWKDRLVEFAGRRTLTDISTDEMKKVDVSRAEGEIFQVGDTFSAANMNDLEQRIAYGFADCPTSLTVKTIEVVTELPSDAADHPDTVYLIID